MPFAVFLFFAMSALSAIILIVCWYIFKLGVLLVYLTWNLGKLVYQCVVPWPWRIGR